MTQVPSRTLFALLVLSLCIASGRVLAELPQVSNARIVQPPPGARVAAGYFTITNTTDDALVITGASSRSVGKVELHLSFIENDVARMEQQASITVPAGESLEFRQGSYHLMMMGLSEPLISGTTVNVTLDTSAGSLPVQLPVISPDASNPMPAMKHDGMTDPGMNHQATDPQ